MYAGTASNQYWTVAYTAIETSAGSGYGTVTFASSAIRAFAFNQVVTFNSLSTSGSTTINGDNITTGQIQSANYGSVSGNYSTAGSIINLTNGNIYTPNFSVIGGTARFKGDLEAAGGTFSGNLSVTGTALIQGTDTTANAFTALKIVNTGSTGKVGFKLQNNAGYFCEMFLNTGTYQGVTGYGIDLNLGTNSNTVAHFNGGGLCVPTGDATVSNHTSAGGRSIFFNSDNAAEGPDAGRLHVNGFFKTFFFDIPTPLTTNPNPPDAEWANKGLVIRKWVPDAGVSGGGYRSEIIWVKNTSSSLHVKGDIVASESSDKRLKDNIKPIQNAAEKISKIGGYEFDWNDNQELYEGHDVGVIAQEIEEVLPEVVETREDGYKAVDYKKIVPLLIEGIKDLQRQIDELKNK
jgi:hypothetical protein